jgi:hypothetical protein
MLKRLYICASILGFSPNQVHAQQQEATLQRIQVPGSAFAVMVALPKPGAANIDLAKSPEAFGVALVGGELALTFESGEHMLQALDNLRIPLGAFHIRDSCGKSLIPAAMYIVPEDGPRDGSERTNNRSENSGRPQLRRPVDSLVRALSAKRDARPPSSECQLLAQSRPSRMSASDRFC